MLSNNNIHILTEVETQSFLRPIEWLSNSFLMIHETKPQRFTFGLNNLVNNQLDNVNSYVLHLDYKIS